MSTYSCPVVRIRGIEKHPDADTLSIVTACGFPVVIRTQDYKEGDLAVYIPEDSLLDVTRPHFAFLKKKENQTRHRVKAVRLRGVYSEGLLVPVSALDEPARMAALDIYGTEDVSAAIGAEKYVETEDVVLKLGTENESDPGFMPYYDLEPYQKYQSYLTMGEEVVVTEKIHGCNSRFCYRDGRLWVGSHGQVKKLDPDNLWWKMAVKYDLEKKLQFYPDLVLYGETYGSVQDLKYGVPGTEGCRLRFFDAFNSNPAARGWQDYDQLRTILETLGLDPVPELYRGPLTPEVLELRTGQSVLDPATIREGIVIRPVQERAARNLGRVVLKYVSEDYKCRVGGTERH